MWKKSLSLTLAALFGCATLGLAATPAVMPAAAVNPLPVQTSQPVDAVASASIPDEEVTPETPKDTQETKEKDTTLPASIKHLDLVLILDKSGSMYGLEKDTIGGYNSMLKKERALHVDTRVTTVLFNNESTLLTNRRDIDAVEDMTSKQYTVGGSTALLDALGNTINRLSRIDGINNKNHKVIVVVITDGLENASHEYSRATIKKMITDKQEQGWDFLFLGANMDAVTEAGTLGIDSDHAVNYQNNARGVRANFNAIAAYTQSTMQQNGDDSWKDEVKQ